MEPQEIIKATAEAVNVQLAEAKKEMATKGEVEAVKGEFKAVTEKLGDIEKGLAEVARKGVEMAASPKESLVKSIEKAVKTLTEKLADGSKRATFVTVSKQVGNMTIAGNTTGTVGRTMVEPGVTNIFRRQFFIEQLADTTTLPAGKNTALWLEQQGIEGGAAMTAEGNAKQQLDWNLVEASATLKKVTSFVKISNEMLSDYEGIMSEINGNLLYQIEKTKETQFFSGTGATVNTNGITKSGYAQPLDLAALANYYALNASNRWDAIGAAISQIETNTEMAAMPNFIGLSPVDYYQLVHGSRTTDNAYNVPPTGVVELNGMATFRGIPVYKSLTIPTGYFLVADMTKYHVKLDGPVSVEMGYDQDDFTKNFVTIRAEQRIAGYIKANEVEAFVYDSFANAKLFLERNT